LLRIANAIEREEPITLLFSSIIDTTRKRMARESLCPDIEYSISETGKNRSRVEIVFAFSAPRRNTLYTIRTVIISQARKKAFRNLGSPSITKGTVAYNDNGG
jgi:hypothetical protein